MGDRTNEDLFEEPDGFALQRERMVISQIEGRGITDLSVLHAMRTVPREVFVLPAYRHYSYDDTPLPIPGEQTISQPYVVALMLSMLQLGPTDRVLEVGTGSGYAAALLGQIAREVHTVERIPELVDYARKRLRQLGYDNVHVHLGDGSLGWAPAAPYDGIVVAAGGPAVPPSLKQQLAVGGRLVMPVGTAERRQHLFCITRLGEDEFERDDMGSVAFVPLIGEEGWT